ncbi:MAG: hypothetical protein WDN28_32050 [Chthoniobacter sp.]
MTGSDDEPEGIGRRIGRDGFLGNIEIKRGERLGVHRVVHGRGMSNREPRVARLEKFSAVFPGLGCGWLGLGDQLSVGVVVDDLRRGVAIAAGVDEDALAEIAAIRRAERGLGDMAGAIRV